MTPAQVLRQGWGWKDAELTPLGAGHINDTLRVSAPGHPIGVLQRINEQVFTDPALVMDNLVRVQAHLASSAPDLIAPLIDALDGQPSYVDETGGWWRLWHFLPDGRTLQQTEDPDICRSAAEAFGRFQKLLADLPGPPLLPTIPGFLELDGYLSQLDEVCADTADAEAAIAAACGSSDFIDQHRQLALALPKGDAVIHGDCKLNNLLFSERSAAIRAVLDLDTIMVGHWAWDFGDLARSVLGGVVQDGPDEPRSLELFRALVAGFRSGCQRALDAPALAVAPRYVAFMLGVRFLTDHLAGDRYFKVAARGENLERAQRQFALMAALPVAELESVAGEVLSG